MVVSTTPSRVTYNGDGSTVAFSFPYKFVAGDLVVLLTDEDDGIETVQTINTHYTIAGAGLSNGIYASATVTFVTAPGTDKVVTIYRAPPLVQETDLTQETADELAINKRLDIIEMKLQRLDNARSRSLRGSEGFYSSINWELPDTTASGAVAGAVPGLKSDKSGFQWYANNGASTSVTATGSTTARTLADRFAEAFNVLDFGGDLQAAVNAANAAGGGRVLVPDDISFATTVTLKNYVVIDILPGVVVSWSGGSSPMFTSASNDVLLNAGIIGYGAVLAMGSSATKALELYGPYQCVFQGFRITGSLITSVAIDIRGDVTGGANPIGNRNPVYNTFADILHSGTCGRFLRLRGEGVDGVSPTYPVVLNTFHNMHCEDARVIGIDLARWVDHNFFSGITRIGIVGNNSVGVVQNSENPSVNCGVYSNHFSALAVDSFGTYTGRIGLVLNNCKDTLIDHFYQFPLAEGGAYSIAGTATAYTIGYFNESLGRIQYLSAESETAGIDTVNPILVDVQNYGASGTSPAQFRAISNAGSTAILSAQSGISYLGSTSNHPTGVIANNTEIARFEAGGNVQLRVAGGALLPQANDQGALGAAATSWSDLFLASGAVLSFAGDVTMTHSANQLLSSGGQFLFRYDASGANPPIVGTNLADAANNVALLIESDRATPAAFDACSIWIRLSDSVGNQDIFCGLQTLASSVTSGAEQGRFDIQLASAGVLTTFYNFTTSALRPHTNDVVALGTATLAWSDLFLASGAVLSFAGDVTLTHSSNLLSLSGGDLQIATGARIDFVDTQTTVGAAGAASALPANPTGYIRVKIGGVARVIPFYAES